MARRPGIVRLHYGGLLLALGGLAAPLAAAPAKEQWAIAGLHAPAELIVDRAGLAHIYAGSVRDAYFLQGYNVARDRLWQIDLWRKRGLGLLSASFGKSFVAQDRAARLFLYRGDMAAEWRRYAPGTEQNYAAFAAGINAFVDDVAAGKQPSPREFALTDSRPAHWSAEDIVRIRSNALVMNAPAEVKRARLICAGGEAADRFNARLQPAHQAQVPAGLDPCAVDADALADYVLATGQVSFASLVGGKPGPLASLPPEAVDGSNNWVIAGSHTTTGRPILANDPHRALTVPSLRYVVHLEAPGLSLIGAGEPSVPGISFGHNAKAAFGLTIFETDQEDVFAYRTQPGHPDRYQYRGRWEPMRLIRDTIPVKGGKPVPVELWFTRHGPVVGRNAAKGRAYAVRSVWSQPGTSAYAAASWLANASNWADFRKAADHWGTPPLNLIWADTSGTTGWIAAGVVPVRRNWDGLMPVPGDGRYEWQGLMAPAKLPSLRNPAQGWIATANQFNTPADQAPPVPVGFEWADPVRFDRLTQILSRPQPFSVADVAATQMDIRDLNALRLTRLARGMSGWDDGSRRALQLLEQWNGDARADSAAAAIAETWLGTYLGAAVVAHAAPAAARPILGRGNLDAELTLMEHRDPLLGGDPQAVIAAVLHDSLAATLDALRARLGPDMDGWNWGRLHRIELDPTISVLASDAEKQAMRVGPRTVGGAGNTVALAIADASGRAVHGPSVRMVMDVGDWDKSLWMNMPGQSADPANPDYRNFLDGWVEGKFAPLPFSRKAVEREAARDIMLTPR